VEIQSNLRYFPSQSKSALQPGAFASQVFISNNHPFSNQPLRETAMALDENISLERYAFLAPFQGLQ